MDGRWETVFVLRPDDMRRVSTAPWTRSKEEQMRPRGLLVGSPGAVNPEDAIGVTLAKYCPSVLQGWREEKMCQ